MAIIASLANLDVGLIGPPRPSYRSFIATPALHHVTINLLRESFEALKKNAAPGVDGVTWREYETGLAAMAILGAICSILPKRMLM